MTAPKTRIWICDNHKIAKHWPIADDKPKICPDCGAKLRLKEECKIEDNLPNYIENNGSELPEKIYLYLSKEIGIGGWVKTYKVAEIVGGTRHSVAKHLQNMRDRGIMDYEHHGPKGIKITRI